MAADYVVNRYGQVWSFKSNKYLTVNYNNTGGYGRVKIGNKYVSVHRLVAEKFIPNPDNLETINHIDEDKTNNHASNLEWMTVGDNKRYSAAVEHTFLSPDGVETVVPCLSVFCRENNLSRGHMHRVLTGERKTHKGWRKSEGGNYRC